jgi:hypothetical protein
MHQARIINDSELIGVIGWAEAQLLSEFASHNSLHVFDFFAGFVVCAVILCHRL